MLDFRQRSRSLDRPTTSRRASGFTGSSASAQPDTYDFVVEQRGRDSCASRWSGPTSPARTGTGKKLINDLDLRVTAPGGTTLPRQRLRRHDFGVSTTGGSADTLNNVENVIRRESRRIGHLDRSTIDPGAGNYSVGQGYALVVTGAVDRDRRRSRRRLRRRSSPGPRPVGTTPRSSSTSPISLRPAAVTSWSLDVRRRRDLDGPEPEPHLHERPGTYDRGADRHGAGRQRRRDQGQLHHCHRSDPVAPVAELLGQRRRRATIRSSTNFTDTVDRSASPSWSLDLRRRRDLERPEPEPHLHHAPGPTTVTLNVDRPRRLRRRDQGRLHHRQRWLAAGRRRSRSFNGQPDVGQRRRSSSTSPTQSTGSGRRRWSLDVRRRRDLDGPEPEPHLHLAPEPTTCP